MRQLLAIHPFRQEKFVDIIEAQAPPMTKGWIIHPGFCFYCPVNWITCVATEPTATSIEPSRTTHSEAAAHTHTRQEHNRENNLRVEAHKQCSTREIKRKEVRRWRPKRSRAIKLVSCFVWESYNANERYALQNVVSVLYVAVFSNFISQLMMSGEHSTMGNKYVCRIVVDCPLRWLRRWKIRYMVLVSSRTTRVFDVSERRSVDLLFCSLKPNFQTEYIS